MEGTLRTSLCDIYLFDRARKNTRGLYTLDKALSKVFEAKSLSGQDALPSNMGVLGYWDFEHQFLNSY